MAEQVYKMIADIINKRLESDTPEDYEPLIQDLVKGVLELQPKIQVNIKPKPTMKSSSKKSKASKSDSPDGKGKSNPYSNFVKVLASVKKKELPDVGDIEVTISPNFKDTNAPCAKRFHSYQDKLLFNDEPISGQTMKFSDLCNIVAAAGSVYSDLTNGMTQTGMIWGLLSSEKRKEILEEALN